MRQPKPNKRRMKCGHAKCYWGIYKWHEVRYDLGVEPHTCGRCSECLRLKMDTLPDDTKLHEITQIIRPYRPTVNDFMLDPGDVFTCSFLLDGAINAVATGRRSVTAYTFGKVLAKLRDNPNPDNPHMRERR